MKINKYITLAIVALVSVSLIAASCNKKGLPHRKYRGQAPRGPSK
jgi:hypothetical protein